MSGGDDGDGDWVMKLVLLMILVVLWFAADWCR